jgi:Ion channel
MHVTALLADSFLLFFVLLDAFQTIILPRRPVGRLRITRLFFFATWYPWTFLGGKLSVRRSREQFYSFYGPLALLLLFIVWALLIIFAYGLIFLGLRAAFVDPTQPGSLLELLHSCLYVSGTTLFTLGIGDVQPNGNIARTLIVMEAETGLGFVALIIGYVPVLYTAFSNREISVSLLDARAGSPPTAGELLTRHNFSGGHEALEALQSEWERWAAGMLETHISYPILCYCRSQHDNQSWLSAITAILDTCSLLITTVEGPGTRQAQLTFAVARHVLVDLGHVFHLEANEQRYHQNPATRLSDHEFGELCQLLAESGFSLCGRTDTRSRLSAIRKLYEPHSQALAEYLHLDLPQWAPPPSNPSKKQDGWRTVAELRSPNAVVDRLKVHVSPRSTASQLSDEETHPF